MSRRMKIWLWIALAISIATTCLNAASGRWSSVIIAVGAMFGLCVLLFTQKKWGFYLTCACYAVAFAIGVYQGTAGGSGLLISVVMSFIGSALIPGITYLFLSKESF